MKATVSINSAGGDIGPDKFDLDRYYNLEELGGTNPGKLKPMSIKIGDKNLPSSERNY